MTKKQIIVKLYKEKFIDGRVLWNLLGSRFKKSELIEIDKTFRKYFKRDCRNNEFGEEGNSIAL